MSREKGRRPALLMANLQATIARWFPLAQSGELTGQA